MGDVGQSATWKQRTVWGVISYDIGESGYTVWALFGERADAEECAAEQELDCQVEEFILRERAS